jgi:hypothetical protein
MMEANGVVIAAPDEGGRFQLVSTWITFLMLLLVQAASRLFYRFEIGWVGEKPADPWADLRLAALLHHTSLFEVLLFGAVPARVLRQLAWEGVAPAAMKTTDRPVAGRFFKALARRVVPITRTRDETWAQVLDAIGPHSLVVIAPEGRMMRRGGRDADGNAMTVRGGIADILDTMPGGRMLLVYSGGLHHIQAPGEGRPRLFETIRVRFENLDIDAYRAARRAEPGGFKAAVIRDLEARRDRHCPRGDRPPPPAADPAPPAAPPGA